MKKFFLLTVGLFMTLSLYGADKASDFTLKDVNGKEHKLSDYEGKTVVLEWVNYDCPFVVKHYASGNMQALQKKYTKKDIVWLSICSSAEGKQGNFGKKEILERMKDQKVKATAYLIDEDGSVGKMYKAKTTPHMYVIDAKGHLVYNGAIDSISSANKKDVRKADNYLVMALDALAAGEAVKKAKTKPYGCSVKYK